MHFFLFLFGTSLAVWPPENHQESRVLRVLGYYVPDNYAKLPWTHDYTDWSNSATLTLGEEIMEEIDDKIGGPNIDIDILWFDQYCHFDVNGTSTCSTMAFYSRKEFTRKNFHEYHDKYLDTITCWSPKKSTSLKFFSISQ